MRKREIVLAFVVTRLALVAVALIALTAVPGVTGTEYHHLSDQPLVDMWYRWDAGYFTQLALHGYGWQHGDRSSDVTFMPLYPWLISVPLQLVAAPDNIGAVVVGLSLSNLCLLLALSLFDRLMCLDKLPPWQRRFAIWLVLLSPASIFFSGVYTESLFFLLSLAAIYNARRERWIIAALAGFLAGATRVVGWVVVVPLMVEAWHQYNRGQRSALASLSSAVRIGRLMAAGTPLLALPLYVTVVGLALHSPLAYFEITRSVWGQGLGPPWQAIADFFGGPIALYGWQRSLLDVVFTVIGLGLVVPAYRHRPSYGLYQLAAVIFPVLAGTFVSMPRYTAAVMPEYISLAHWTDRHRFRAAALLALSGCLAAWFTVRFVTWHWIA